MKMKERERQSALGHAWDILFLLDDLNSGDPKALERLRECVGWKEEEPPTLGDLIAWDFEHYYAAEHGGWEPCGLAEIGRRRKPAEATKFTDFGLSDPNQAIRGLLFVLRNLLFKVTTIIAIDNNSIWPDGCDDNFYPHVTVANVRAAADVLMKIADAQAGGNDAA
jgi:hypothetical protein